MSANTQWDQVVLFVVSRIAVAVSVSDQLPLLQLVRKRRRRPYCLGETLDANGALDIVLANIWVEGARGKSAIGEIGGKGGGRYGGEQQGKD